VFLNKLYYIYTRVIFFNVSEPRSGSLGDGLRPLQYAFHEHLTSPSREIDVLYRALTQSIKTMIPTHYTTREECLEHQYDGFDTNPRYPTYKQRVFTAGDEQQFIAGIRRDLKRPTGATARGDHRELAAIDVLRTYDYLAHKYRKGIFVQVRGGVAHILPFNNSAFSNDWSRRLPPVAELVPFFKKCAEREGRKFNPRSVQMDASKWTANNGILRYDVSTPEIDATAMPAYDMIRETAEAHELPDCDFFVNRRDFPLLRVDGLESYDRIYGKCEAPIPSDELLPILSMCVNADGSSADLLMPTWNDWTRENPDRFYPRCLTKSSSKPHTKLESSESLHSSSKLASKLAALAWGEKKPVVVFRGSSTGLNTGTQGQNLNPRLKAAEMALTASFPLDAGITRWNLRPRFTGVRDRYDQLDLETIDADILDRIPLVEPLTPAEQSTYKYILHIDGHVSAYRLGLELSLGSVILKVDSPYKTWISERLVPFRHYIPVRADLSDLEDVYRWCVAHDDECFAIAQNAASFYEAECRKPGILSYLADRIRSIASTQHYVYGPDLQRLWIEDERLNIPISEAVEASALQLVKTNKRHSLYTNHAGDLLYKVLSEDNEMHNLIHEAFIGITVLNPLLAKDSTLGIRRTVSYSPSGSIAFEHVKGIDLLAYILSPSFSMDGFLGVVQSVCTTLTALQKACDFMHNDLYPWNIIVVDEERAVLVDYSRASCIASDKRLHGSFDFCKARDMLTLLVSSISAILSRKKPLDRKDLSILFHVASFFMGTRFTREQVFSSVKDLRTFCDYTKKFSVMKDKYIGILDRACPDDLYAHIASLRETGKPSLPNLKWRRDPPTFPRLSWYILDDPYEWERVKTSKGKSRRAKAIINTIKEIARYASPTA
jgi:hypothetical protein